MSNIYFKVTIEMFLKLRFSGFKKHDWILKLLVATKKSDIWEKNCVAFVYVCKMQRCCDFFEFAKFSVRESFWSKNIQILQATSSLVERIPNNTLLL